MLAAACVPATQTPNEPPPVSGAVICDETRQARADLSAALVDTQDDRALMAGFQLITLIDAGCAG
jgi:hypothetical protein